MAPLHAAHRRYRSGRSRAEYDEGIRADLLWLGLAYDVFARQSEREASYLNAADKLKAAGFYILATKCLPSWIARGSARRRADCRRFMTAPR